MKVYTLEGLEVVNQGTFSRAAPTGRFSETKRSRDQN